MLLWAIRYFLAVPEHRYFTCAAEALHRFVAPAVGADTSTGSHAAH
jgi:hypothetical protein